jgi:hypothetical protein
MKWARRIFVFLFSIVLLASLVSIALATSAQVGLAHPSKIEGWLDQSNLYSSLSTTIANKAQNSIENNVSGGVSISKTLVQQAAQSAFPQSLLKQSVQTFINSNYEWLEGKSTTPNFTIDLSGAKQAFATQVAEASVVAHLTGLPTCTAAQTLQLENANPLLLSCLPAGISPQLEASQVSQQVVNDSSFLSKPVITASTVSTKGLNGGEPYYKKLSALPKSYQLAKKLPWILGIISILSILIIVFCSRSKRIGIRFIGIILLISGLLLVADKFLTDFAFNKLKDRAFNSVGSSQIQQSLTSFVHFIEKELVKIDLWFGLGYVALAVVLIGILILTRHRTAKSKGSSTNKSGGGARAITPADNIYGTDSPGRQPKFNTITPDTKTAQQNPKKRTNRRPPGLIQ